MPTYCLQSVPSKTPCAALAVRGGGEGFDKEGWIRLVTVRKKITNENQATVFKYCIPQLTLFLPPLSEDFLAGSRGKNKKTVGR